MCSIDCESITKSVVQIAWTGRRGVSGGWRGCKRASLVRKRAQGGEEGGRRGAHHAILSRKLLLVFFVRLIVSPRRLCWRWRAHAPALQAHPKSMHAMKNIGASSAD